MSHNLFDKPLISSLWSNFSPFIFVILSATVSRVTGQVRRAFEADCATGGLDEEDSLEDPLTVANTLEFVALDVLELVVVSLRALGLGDDRPSSPVS
jgi:hypothetical protein